MGTSCEAARVAKPKASLRALGYIREECCGSRGAATEPIELIPVAAPQLQTNLRDVTQGSQTRPGLTYDRRSAAR